MNFIRKCTTRAHTVIYPQTALRLVGGIDRPNSVILFFEKDDVVAQRLANGTGADVIFADSKEDKLVSLLRSIDGRRKIGVFGNDSSSLAFAVNQLQHQTPQPLNAVVTVAKEPISFDPADRIKELPLQSPTLVVFQNVSYTQKHSPTPAEQLSQLWGSAISKDGGIHSHGFHKDEAQVIDAGSSKDDEIMQPVCKFFVKHLRSA